MTKIRKTALAFGTACAIAFTGGIAAMNVLPAVADGGATVTNSISGYYGHQLKDGVAIAFYNELDKMNTPAEGLSEFRRGAEHEITDGTVKAALETAVQAYVKGDMTLIKQFGAALDCFRYDHPDLFYIDFNRLTVNVTEVKSETPPEGGGETGGGDESGTPEAREGEGSGEGAGDNGGNTGDDNGGDTENPDTPAPEAPKEYKVTIGKGRASTYLLFDPDELNGTTGTTEPEPAAEGDPEPGTEEPGTSDTPETPETPKEPTLFEKYETAYAALIQKINDELSPPVTNPDEGGEAAQADINYSSYSVEKKVYAVNKVLGESFSYGFGNNYVNTTYFITETGSRPEASSEGLARLFKTVMKTIGVAENNCLIVSGYYVVDGTAKACVWNYVKDGGSWYGVDVANNMTGDNKYLFATGDAFFLDHYENPVVSLSNHRFEYPGHSEFVFNEYNVVTGELQVANGVCSFLENKAGIAVKYTGTGGTLVLREKGENGDWSEVTFETLLSTEGKGYTEPEPTTPPDENPETPPEGGGETGGGDESGTPEAREGEGSGEGAGDNGGNTGDDNGGDTENPGDTEKPEPEPAPDYKIAKGLDGIYYLFGLTEGNYEIVVKKDNKIVEVNETVADSLDKDVVGIPLAPNDLRLSARPIEKTTIGIVFGKALKKIDDGAKIGVDFTVGSLEEAELLFVKDLCVLGEAALGEDNKTLTFEFTPCGLTKYSGLKYTFTFSNLIEIVEEGQEAKAVPATYSLVFKYEGGNIGANGVSVGSNLYTDIVTQPSLVFNNDLSLAGWKYGGKDANDNMIGALALSVGKPAEDLTDAIGAAVAANTTLFQEGAFVAPSVGEGGTGEGDGEGETPTVTPNAIEAYSLNLTLDGKEVTIPEGTYLKLAFPYPDGCEPREGAEGDALDETVFKAFRFKRDAKGNVDYGAAPDVLDVVAARQGLIVAVNDPSATYALVAFEKEKTSINQKVVLTETSGVGGTVVGSPVNAVTVGNISYTIKPDAGYMIDCISVNGVAQRIPAESNGTYTFTLNGNGTSGDYAYSLSNTYNVLRVEFRPEDASGDGFAVANTAAAGFVTEQLARKQYSTEEKNSIITKYPVGGLIFAPKDPIIPVTASETMHMIIVLGVVGGIALIGAIAIIYCGAIRPKILREREEEAERLAAQRERRANRSRSGSSYDSRRR